MGRGFLSLAEPVSVSGLRRVAGSGGFACQGRVRLYSASRRSQRLGSRGKGYCRQKHSAQPVHLGAERTMLKSFSNRFRLVDCFKSFRGTNKLFILLQAGLYLTATRGAATASLLRLSTRSRRRLLVKSQHANLPSITLTNINR